MRCIVIDDEKPGLDLICGYIDNIPFLELVGAFATVGEALKVLVNNDVDLIFSDIELNGSINGVQLCASLQNPPLVIFITAYDRYAIEGYSLDAVDYLLKPVSPERFLKAANKAYQLWLQNHAPKSAESLPAGNAAPAPTPAPAPDYLFIKTENRLLKIFLRDILFIEGCGDYIKIHLSDKRQILSLQSLNAMEGRLSDNFIRTHRSYIVALDKIDEIERRRIRIGKEIIPISENYQERFFARIQDQSGL